VEGLPNFYYLCNFCLCWARVSGWAGQQKELRESGQHERVQVHWDPLASILVVLVRLREVRYEYQVNSARDY